MPNTASPRLSLPVCDVGHCFSTARHTPAMSSRGSRRSERRAVATSCCLCPARGSRATGTRSGRLERRPRPPLPQRAPAAPTCTEHAAPCRHRPCFGVSPPSGLSYLPKRTRQCAPTGDPRFSACPLLPSCGLPWNGRAPGHAGEVMGQAGVGRPRTSPGLNFDRVLGAGTSSRASKDASVRV